MSQIPAAGKSNQIKWRPREKTQIKSKSNPDPENCKWDQIPAGGFARYFLPGGNGHSFVVESSRSTQHDHAPVRLGSRDEDEVALSSGFGATFG